MHRVAVNGERILVAGDQAWGEYVDDVLERCAAAATDAATWEACIADTRDVDEKIGKALTASVKALRVYWKAAAAQDRAGMLSALKELAIAAQDLPDEQFGGIKSLLSRFL
jgi:hypothetical protein